jgi:hypothetical protein
MTGKLAESIRRGLEEALAYAEGNTDSRLYGVRVPEDIEDDRRGRMAFPAQSRYIAQNA